MTVITPLFREIVIKYDFNIDPRVLEKLLSGKGTIHYNTALKVAKQAREVTGNAYSLKKLFNLDELRGYEVERKVIYTYSEKGLSDEEGASLIRYILEKRWYP